MMSMTLGSKGDSIRELQAKLAENGFDPGPTDGVFGDSTRKAVVNFQRSKNLNADGIVGPITLKALDIKVSIEKPEKEREQFSALLLQNPNYFGNLKVSKYKAVKALKNKTSYEELKCLGYDPHLEQLEAVVYLKKSYGYGGGLCSTGTSEYVRFFVDWNNDGNWVDMGMSHFTAYNIPGDKPLEYSVTLKIDPNRKFCFIENLPKVRAILSWKNPPTAGDPDFVPVWGNVQEARIQIDVLKYIVVKDFLQMASVDLPDTILNNINLDQTVDAIEPKELALGELAELYKDKGVPSHRFTYSKVIPAVERLSTTSVLDLSLSSVLSEMQIDIAELVENLFKTDGDTSYEELNCIGYNPNSYFKHLSGVLTIKRPYGYSGDLCKKGSREYVAYWEWDEIEATWLYLGTTSVDVHDISSIPSEGLKYAVSLPVDFTRHRRPCNKGPVDIRIRAIMSWQVPPSPTNPHWVPTWGNREETNIHIKPGPQNTGLQIPYIESVGNMAVCSIDQGNGLASGEDAGALANFTADRSPFARGIIISGSIDYPPTDVLESGGATALKYKVFVRPHNLLNPQPWEALDNQFEVWIKQKIGANPWTQSKKTQKVDANGYYEYLKDLGGARLRDYLTVPVLAEWQTNKSHSGKWDIRIEAKTSGGITIYGGTILCDDGSSRSTVIVQLDNEEPKPTTINLTGVQSGGTGPVNPAVACGKFIVGDIIHGTYSVSDDYFGRLTLSVIPAGPAHGAAVSPSVRSFDIVPTTGETGSWTLDTTGMDPCGYVVRLWTRDRAIVDSRYIGLRNHDDIGFCLVAPHENDEGGGTE